MRKLSVVIITFNEEENIARCIRSVSNLADEIIVLDSFSADSTTTIAASLGARIFKEKFRSYIGQKNAAIRLANHDLVLSLDADECLDDTLNKAIREEKNTKNPNACSMNRCTSYCGRFIKHGLWYPDKKLRLFDRRLGAWGGLNPHDKVILKPGTPIKHLPGNILHYSFYTTEDLVRQNNRLSSMAATSLFTAGKRTSLLKLFVNPFWAFFNGYFLRRGFLDGFDGWTIAIHSAYQVFLKHSKLYRLQKEWKQARVTPLPQEEIQNISANL